MTCGCMRCAREAADGMPEEITLASLDIKLIRFFACEICGNKRCPHSDDHRNACTGSNEPGQPGSRYE